MRWLTFTANHKTPATSMLGERGVIMNDQNTTDTQISPSKLRGVTMDRKSMVSTQSNHYACYEETIKKGRELPGGL